MNSQSLQEITNLDLQIEQLMKCKPLPEADVKLLCDKVNNLLITKE